MGTTGSGNVPNNIYDGGRITVVSGRIGRVKWYAAECTTRKSRLPATAKLSPSMGTGRDADE